MIKKLIKFCVVGLLILAVLLITAFFVLKKMYPPAKLKVIAQNYVSEKLQREFTFDSISFTWIGFTLTNAALSEDHTFQEGTFIKANKLTAHVAVKPLLQKRIEISTIEAEGLETNIIAKRDGTFNFDTLISTQQNGSTQNTQTTTSNENDPLVVIAQKIKLTDCDLIYRDEQSGLRTALNDLNIEITDFDLNHPFTTTIDFITDISGTGKPDMRFPLSLKFTTQLAGLDLPNAYATLSQATARYKTIQLDLQGEIKNFKTPSVNLTGSLEGVNNTVLSDLAPGLSAFNIPTIHLILNANANLDTKNATISQAKLSIQDSSLLVKGTVNWSGPRVSYNLSAALTAIINQLVQMAETSLDNFSPAGTINASLHATEKKDYTDINGNIVLKNVSLLYEPFTLTEVNGNIALASLKNISSPALSGKLNNEAFTGDFSYIILPAAADIKFNLNLDKLILTKFSSSSTSTTQGTPTNSAETAAENTEPTLPMNIQANVKVGGISVPYLQSNGLTLKANLTNITDSMSHANGTIDFALQPGKITNLDDFIKESKIAKILLLPIGIVKRVAGILKINLFPTDNTQGTTISFTEGAGAYTFTDGTMNVDRTILNSSATNISATGTANFQTDALDMKAKATLLTQAAPIAFKITGTMSNPKGKLDVVNTVTSVVGGILNGTAIKSAANGTASLTKETADTATDTVKSTISTATNVVKGIGDLFKKKNTEEK